MKTNQNEPLPKKYLFEEQNCSRCGGTGKYSYCQSYGNTCFKCHGSGRTLTKKGQAAQDFYRQSRMVKASALKVGDYIKTEGITMSMASYSYKALIISIERSTSKNSSGTRIDGIMVTKEYYPLIITTKSEKFGESGLSCSDDSEVMIYRQDDKERIALALLYQSTLTKTGTVRKAKA